MRILTSTKGMDIEEWRNLRRKSLGGSDASVIVGLNNWKSSYTLWADKKGYLPNTEDNEAMRIGSDLEEYVARRFTEATGKKVKRRNYMFLHDKYDFITANVDREIVGEKAGLECKTTNVFAKSDFENGEIPLYYYCQCMHYMAVMGYEKMYLAVLVLGKAFYWFEINRDENEINNLIEAEKEWWTKYIINDEIPEIDGSSSTENTVTTLYPDSNGTTIYDSNLKDDVKMCLNLKAKIKELQEISKGYESKIKATMGEAENCLVDNYKVAWKNQERRSVDTKKLKDENPEIYNEYLKVTKTRVLRIKGVC